MKPQHRELPIFLDVSGRRWRNVKLWLAVTLLVIVAIAGWMGGRILSFAPSAMGVSAASGKTSPIGPVTDMSVDQLAGILSATNVPVIGEGPLVRVVKINGTAVSGVFYSISPRQLTAPEVIQVGSHQYAIERYGVTPHNKRLVLTFDDGPDLVYTTQLLNVLAEESVPATFFLVGGRIIQHPDVAQRIVREGHGIANHSFTHADFETIPTVLAEQEINLTQRALRMATGYSTTFFRPPYVGDNDQSLRDSVRGILNAQKLGYVVALYDHDTDDWKYTEQSSKIELPPFDGKDHVLLLHDGGGKREATVGYVRSLIKTAKQQGYSFVSLNELYPSEKSYLEPTQPSIEDSVFMSTAQAALVWPMQTMLVLFTVTIVFVFLGMGVYVVLAIIQNKRTAEYARLTDSSYRPSVAIIVPAFNEEKVLRGCVRSLLKSSYKKLKIYIVDDGSTDNTWRVAQALSRRYRQVTALHQPNGGKASAVNRGIRRTQSSIIIGIDADTHFQRDTVSRLVRHFANPEVGAVAGLVRVGNRTNTLARCQALEYSTSISLERTAQAMLGAIMVVPGACGAWRRKAIIQAGRYSSSTLAEDCDLTMALHMTGYKIIQDNTAVALTEVPTTIRSFARQRFRWTFGNIQVYWKYQDALFSNRRSWLDSFVLPMAIASTIGPLIFLPLLGAITLSNLMSGQYLVLLLFMTITFAFQLFRTWVALLLGREKLRYLWLVPIARLLYGPLRIYLIYGTILRAFQGVPVGWSKLTRVGMMFQKERAGART